MFSLVFQAFTPSGTGYIAFTNYGHQHTLDKAQAINALGMSKIRLNASRVRRNIPSRSLKRTASGFAVIDDGKIKSRHCPHTAPHGQRQNRRPTHYLRRGLEEPASV